MITLDVENQKLHLEVSDEEIKARLSKWSPEPIPNHYKRGWANLCILLLLLIGYYFTLQDINHVTQAHLGADMDFLIGSSGTPTLRESH